MDVATARPRDGQRVEFGDWQTPAALAREVCAVLARAGTGVAAVLEPTCGEGAFLEAAIRVFPRAALYGFDVAPAYVESTRSRLNGRAARIEQADFFVAPWESIVGELPQPFVILGNPPWVTSAGVGRLGGRNLPARTNRKGARGLDALTGKSNFDVSEWMLLRLLDAARGKRFTLAMLCKAAVARRVVEHITVHRFAMQGELRVIDAQAHFKAAVDAVLLVVRPGSSSAWAVYPSLQAAEPSGHLGAVDGRLCPDVAAYRDTMGLAGTAEIAWRSGVKHDCAAVMELKVADNRIVNGSGEPVDIEAASTWPLLKGSDLARNRLAVPRRVIVTQRRLSEDPAGLARLAPRLWHYLVAHRRDFEARKSRIYRARPPFSMFGVGDYSFAPYKVAIAGLYKEMTFRVVPPRDGQAVMLDDTSYFLPCDRQDLAVALADALNGQRARAFFAARMFGDAKRPVTKALLQSLSLRALLRAEGQCALADAIAASPG